MIGFLRFVGLLNAAVWFGAAVFLTFGAEPAIFSQDTQGLLLKSHAYLSVLLAQIVRTRFFYLSLACAAVALLHLLAEWLYLGRPPRKFLLGLLAALVGLALCGGWGLQPALKKLHTARTLAPQPAERQAAQASFHRWQTVAQALDLLTLGGLAVYLWRLANPPDTLRFVNPAQLRG